MNILHIYDGHEKVYDGRGSVPNVVWNLARETAAQGHDVTVLERQWEDLDPFARHEGVAFERLSLRTGSDTPWTQVPYEMVATPIGATTLLLDRANFALQALRRLRGRQFDAVHVHLPFAANVLATVAPWLRSKLVYTAHIGETESRVVDARVSPDVYLARRAARTIVLNPEMQRAFESRGVPADRLTVIPNGVDVARFRQSVEDRRRHVEAEYGLDDTRVVLFVGTVTPRKGVKDLIRAAGQVLPDRDEDVRLVVVGKSDMEPEYTESVRSAVEELGIEQHVLFTGFVPDEQIPAFYDLAEVFVLPSYEEGSSIAVTEAIASGTPTVGARISGIEQQLVDGEHGLLVEPGDVEGLAEALGTLLDDEERLGAMARAMGERAEELSWPRITNRIIDVYEGIQS